MTHAFSGGRETAKLQRELGADLDIDVAYQWLRFFLEDDEELDAIGKSYGSGQGPYWNTAAVKERLVVELQKLVRAHKARRDVPTCVELNQRVGFPCWLCRAARNRHRHAIIEQASRRWRGGRRGNSARTRREILISTQVLTDSDVDAWMAVRALGAPY